MPAATVPRTFVALIVVTMLASWQGANAQSSSALATGTEGGVVECDREHRLVRIHPLFGKMLDSADNRAQEHPCGLPGLDVLVRWGKVSLWDMPSVEQYFVRMSVWVNGAKWIDRAIVDDAGWGFADAHSDHDLLVSAEVSASGIMICHDRRSAAANESTEDPPTEQPVCSSTPRGQLPASVDRVEFPATGKQRPPAYTTRIVASRDATLCNAALAPAGRSDAFSLPSDATVLNDAAAPGFADGLPNGEQVLFFDVDNSGHSQRVVHHQEATHASMSDTYFVYTEAALKQLVTASSQSFEDLQSHAAAVFPSGWEVCVKTDHGPGYQATCAPHEQQLMPFTMTDVDHREIRFRDQYMSMTPFRYHDVTYFALTSADNDVTNVAFVVRPAPGGHVELACSLESVSPYL